MFIRTDGLVPNDVALSSAAIQLVSNLTSGESFRANHDCLSSKRTVVVYVRIVVATLTAQSTVYTLVVGDVGRRPAVRNRSTQVGQPAADEGSVFIAGANETLSSHRNLTRRVAVGDDSNAAGVGVTHNSGRSHVGEHVTFVTEVVERHLTTVGRAADETGTVTTSYGASLVEYEVLYVCRRRDVTEQTHTNLTRLLDDEVADAMALAVEVALIERRTRRVATIVVRQVPANGSEGDARHVEVGRQHCVSIHLACVNQEGEDAQMSGTLNLIISSLVLLREERVLAQFLCHCTSLLCRECTELVAFPSVEHVAHCKSVLVIVDDTSRVESFEQVVYLVESHCHVGISTTAILNLEEQLRILVHEFHLLCAVSRLSIHQTLQLLQQSGRDGRILVGIATIAPREVDDLLCTCCIAFEDRGQTFVGHSVFSRTQIGQTEVTEGHPVFIQTGTHVLNANLNLAVCNLHSRVVHIAAGTECIRTADGTHGNPAFHVTINVAIVCSFTRQVAVHTVFSLILQHDVLAFRHQEVHIVIQIHHTCRPCTGEICIGTVSTVHAQFIDTILQVSEFLIHVEVCIVPAFHCGEEILAASSGLRTRVLHRPAFEASLQVGVSHEHANVGARQCVASHHAAHQITYIFNLGCHLFVGQRVVFYDVSVRTIGELTRSFNLSLVEILLEEYAVVVLDGVRLEVGAIACADIHVVFVNQSRSLHQFLR